MNYLKVYCNLIRKAENRTPPEGYIEKHHTFPVSIFGKNNRIVVLTAREHYIIHALLEKICIKRYGLEHWKTKKMNFAHCLMKTNPSNKRYYNSYLYESAKIRNSFLNSAEKSVWWGKNHTEETKNKMRKASLKRWSSEQERIKIKGKNNHFYGKKHTEETKNKIGLKSKIRSSGNNNPRTKTWKLTFENNEFCVVDCLMVWCKSNGYNYGSVYNVYKNLSKNHRGIVSVTQL